MKLLWDWRTQLNRLWSIRVAIFMAMLASADQILQLFTQWIPPVAYAILSLIFILLRLTYQPVKVKDADSETK